MTQYAPLIIDIVDKTLSTDDRRRLTHPLVGGITLFSRNWENRHQLTKLCSEIKSIRNDLLICVDQEGGRVQRFRGDGFTSIPAMHRIGSLCDASFGEAILDSGHKSLLQAMNSASAVGYVLASELRACNVDLSFTPVLDINWSASSVIGDRAFHKDTALVTLLARSLLEGLQNAGMSHCAKHFPGHGFATADTHTHIAYDQRALESILQRDAAPYGWLSSSLNAVMAAHVIYPEVDNTLPAGYSKRWLQSILRQKLHFTGAIFCDDLSMAGGRMINGKTVTITQAAITALNAGCDLLLLCNQSLNGGKVLDAWIDGMETALQQKLWKFNEQSERRRISLLPKGERITWDEMLDSQQYQNAQILIQNIA